MLFWAKGGDDMGQKFFHKVKIVLGSGFGVIFAFAVLLVIAYCSICLPRPTYPPLILIDGTFYTESSTMDEIPDGAKYLGKMIDPCARTKAPSQSFQANHDVKCGSEVYLLSNDDIIVWVGNEWQRYHKHSD